MIKRMGLSDADAVHSLVPTNDELADKLETVSDLLTAQGADRFRAQAYHRAGETLRELDQPAWQIYMREGIEGLEELPGVGRTISRVLQQLIKGGRWALLDRLQGKDVAEDMFATVPGVGEKLAKRIHDELGIETLAELQAAAWDRRLQKMDGFGEKRLRAVRESLSSRGRDADEAHFGKQTQRRLFPEDPDLSVDVPVAELLDVDREYRERAKSGTLPRVAPRRFNPTAEVWLPILHTERGDHHYTAMFSNSAHAHEMGTTHDWVVIYLEDHNNRGQTGRWTVITSLFGKLKGRRIVRGHEHECAKFYKKQNV